MVLDTQTIPYAVLLVLLAGASNNKLLLVLAITFIIGAIVAKEAGYDVNIANMVGLTLCAVAIGIMVKPHSVENFKIMQYTTEQDPKESPKVDCGIYYVPEAMRPACDQGYFNKSIVQLGARLMELNQKKTLSSAEKTEKTNIEQTIQARKNSNVPGNGYGCKITLPGLKSQVMFDFTDKTTMNARNDKSASGAATDSTKNWAHCYKPFDKNSDAINFANSVGSRGQITATKGTTYSFADSSKYFAKVTFNKLDFNNVKNSVCAMATSQLPPTNDVFLGFTIDEKKVIKSFDVFSVDNQNLVRFESLSAVNNNNDAFGMLFELAAEDKDIYFRPKANPIVQIVNMNMDLCGKLQTITRAVTQFNLTMIGITKQFITKIPDGINFTNGVSSIETQYNDMLKKYLSMQNKIDALKKAEADLQSTPNLIPGLTMVRYDVISGSPPPANNQKDMDNVWKTTLKNKVVSKEPNPNFNTQNTNKPSEMKAWEFIGYVDVPSDGNYRFKIRSDDAGELYVGESLPNTTDGQRANVLVATHYGYHGTDDTGISLAGPNGKGFYLKQGPNKFYVRVFDWTGWEGLMVYWKQPDANDWTLIPEEKYMQDTNQRLTSNYGTEIDMVKKDMATLSTRMDTVNEFKSALTSSTRAMVESMMLQCIGRVLNVPANNVTALDRVYFFAGNPAINSRVKVGPSTKQVLVPDVLDLSKSYRMISTPFGINFSDLPVYSVSLWINVTGPVNQWRSILFFGASDQWGKGNGKVDRTPGVWIYPSEVKGANTKVFVNIRHRVNTAAKPSTNSFNWGQDIYDPKTSPQYGTWFHVAYTVNKTVIQVYLNGTRVGVTDFKKTNPKYAFEWNIKTGKKFFVGTVPDNRLSVTPKTSPIYIQKLYWYNSELKPSDIVTLSKESIVPTPSAIVGDIAQVPAPPSPANTIQRLFENVTGTGINFLKIGQFSFPVWVMVKYNRKWILILNYEHKQGTNPNLYVRKAVDGFPIQQNRLGFDGSAEKQSWGHVGNSLLNALYTQCGGFTRMLFYAQNSKGKLINFITTDQRMIDYARTGKGRVMNGLKGVELLDGHNATIPTNAPDSSGDQGDFALTSYPFWRAESAHWALGGNGGRWEVDDYIVPQPGVTSPDTVHQVYIGI